MIFNEIYSAYYNTVAKILSAVSGGECERTLQAIVSDNAFSDSVLTVLPSLKSGKWPLVTSNLSPVLRHTPTMPLTLLQKRWLKAVSLDRRIRLFGAEFPELDGIEPLFTENDYKIFDRYSDGDSFDSEEYIQNFKVILEAVKSEKPVRIKMTDRHGNTGTARFYPLGLEYSAKDDKFRAISKGSQYKRFNLGRIEHAEICEDFEERRLAVKEHFRELTLSVTDERNALERAMLHFAHFEKRAERIDGDHYLLKIKYYENDETEIVIRVLSFGPFVKAVSPQKFEDLIKERLAEQLRLSKSLNN